MNLKLKSKTNKCRDKMRSKVKRSNRPTNNKRRRIHLALWLILKALNLKKLKETVLLKRKMLMQKTKQLLKIRYL